MAEAEQGWVDVQRGLVSRGIFVDDDIYRLERDRIFEYMKRRRLPDAGQRQIRRDLRNSGDLYADVRDLEFHPDIEQA